MGLLKRYFLLLLSGLLISHSALADGKVLLRGIVRDAYDKNLVENAHVVINELHIGTITNSKGVFTFGKLPPGSYEIIISHIGYYEQKHSVTLDSTWNEEYIFIIPKIVEINPVTITATLNERKLSKLPGRLAVIGGKQVELLPAQNTDDLLLGIANVHINRPWGIFTKGASVTMRGLPGSSRTLIMLDGVPMNKVAGGTVNWNFIEPSDIDNIEVVKGPNSALYGNNAMGGVINITTKRPQKALEGNVRTFGGSLGTFGGSFNVGGLDLYKGKGLYWNTKGFLRKGDGYIIEPEETRTSTDSKVGLDEYSLGLMGGYRFDTASTLDLEYRYYDGTFGTGTKVYTDDGAYDQYRSHLVLGSYNAIHGKYKLNVRLYYQLENYHKQSESLSSSSGKYKLSDTYSKKHDNGLWINLSRIFFKNHLFTAGLEFKMGDLDAEELYRTSTDEVYYGGNINLGGIFLQDEFSIGRKLSFIAGLRFDYASFQNGFQNIENPTSNTGFIENTSTEFQDESWTKLSPKLAIQYQLSKRVSMYVSAATGFMPPKIDDMSKSGKISKGFKLANPSLKPESLSNYELGATWMAAETFSIEPSVYYSIGKDFQYFVATGDSVDTGGTDLKPVLQRQNVTEVEILGGEITARWEVFTNIVVTANYSMNNSRIIKFNDPKNEYKNLTGKALIEVPLYEAYASLSWRNRIVNFIVDWRYTAKEWYDDENTQYVEPYSLIGLKLTKTLKQRIGFSLSVQNILNNVTIDRKGMLSPGRFIIGEIFFEI